MKKLLLSSLLLIDSVLLHAGTPLLNDDFGGSSIKTNLWNIPYWVSSSDGTYIGRTQFRVSQNSPFPPVSGGEVLLTVESYNPTGYSFYGTELISNRWFAVGEGLRLSVRAKMANAFPGVVGGIFLYALKPGSSTLHDEIDFELVTKRPNEVQTNIYGNEPLGTGHPQYVPFASGSITDYHTYAIEWLPSRVSWYVDGALVRTTTSNVPSGPMRLYFNLWVPDAGWTEAYEPSLQPVSSASANVVWNILSVDSANVQAVGVGWAQNISYGWLYEDGNGWHGSSELGWVSFLNAEWAWSTYLNGWLWGDGSSTWLWSPQYQWLYASGDGDNWYLSSALGWMAVGNYGGPVWTLRFGWVWPNGDGTYFYSYGYGWLGANGSGGVWSYSYSRWL